MEPIPNLSAVTHSLSNYDHHCSKKKRQLVTAPKCNPEQLWRHPWCPRARGRLPAQCQGLSAREEQLQGWTQDSIMLILFPISTVLQHFLDVRSSGEPLCLCTGFFRSQKGLGGQVCLVQPLQGHLYRPQLCGPPHNDMTRKATSSHFGSINDVILGMTFCPKGLNDRDSRPLSHQEEKYIKEESADPHRLVPASPSSRK